MDLNIDHDEIKDRREYDFPNAEMLQEYRAYSAGDQTDILTADQRRLLGPRSTHATTDNVVRLVLQSTASRLKLTGWTTAQESPTAIDSDVAISESSVAAIEAHLQGVWLKNTMAKLQYQVHYRVGRDGNTAIMLGWRDGRVRIWKESWWDGYSGMFVFYRDDHTYDYAVKEWDERISSSKILRRRNVYQEGRIDRFVERESGWSYISMVKPGEQDTIELVRADGITPLPIPVVHFSNADEDSETPYGRSDISTIIGLQDDLNSSQRDLTAAGLLTAFQRLFISGMESPQKSFKLAPGSAFGDPSPDAKLQVVEPGDPSAIIKIHDNKRQVIALGTRTPMHVITGQWPSGAAFLQADMPSIDKARSLGDAVGPDWTTVAHRSTEWANAFGKEGLDENIPLVSEFEPVERIDQLTQLEIDRKKADLWNVISSMPREAMIQTGIVDEDTADQIIADRENASERTIARMDI